MLSRFFNGWKSRNAHELYTPSQFIFHTVPKSLTQSRSVILKRKTQEKMPEGETETPQRRRPWAAFLGTAVALAVVFGVVYQPHAQDERILSVVDENIVQENVKSQIELTVDSTGNIVEEGASDAG